MQPMLVSNGVRTLGEHGPVATVAQRILQLVDRLNQRYCAAEKVSIAVTGCGDWVEPALNAEVTVVALPLLRATVAKRVTPALRCRAGDMACD
jgi:hypothetical protein